MKHSQYKLARNKYVLREKQQKGMKFVVWKLSKEQLDFLGRFYDIEPFLFEITTRTFCHPKELPSLLKDIDYQRRYHNKKKVVRKLNAKERKLLEKWEVSYEPYKHKIYLNP